MLDALRRGDVESALQLGSTLLDNTVDLLTLLIHAVAEIGTETHVAGSWVPWNALVRDLHATLTTPIIHERQIFTLIIRICMIRLQLPPTYEPPIHMQRLRRLVIDRFPAAAQLSAAGSQRFEPLFPAGQAEKTFVTTILAGLTRLWTEQPWSETSRLALQYLSRKKTVIPMNGWPAPTAELGRKGDLVFTLWGAMILFTDAPAVLRRYDLFCWNFSPAHKGARIGLLTAGIAAVSETELDAFAPHMSEQALVELAMEMTREREREETPDIVTTAMQYVPKKIAEEVREPEPEKKAPTKVIRLKTRD